MIAYYCSEQRAEVFSGLHDFPDKWHEKHLDSEYWRQDHLSEA